MHALQAEGQTGFTVNDREGEMMEPTDAEDDLLDMAFGLEATSRYFNEPTSRILSPDFCARACDAC